MKSKDLIIIVLCLVLISCHKKAEVQKPPLAEVKPVTETYFGKTITDPYRYMEDTKDSAALKWIKAQSVYARNTLNGITGRQGLIDKMVEFDKRKPERNYSLYITENDHYFYLKQTPKDETGKLYHRIGLKGSEELLFDPQTYGTDTTQKYTISAMYPSFDGKLLGLEVAANGSESAVLQIMDVAGKKIYPEKIDRIWDASVSWLPDGKSMLYLRLQNGNVHDPNHEKDAKTYLHVLGTDPSKDKEFFSRAKNPDLKIKEEEFPVAVYDKDSKSIFGLIATVNRNLKVYMAPLSELNKDQINWKLIVKESDQVYNFVSTEKDLYLYTPKGAPNFKILKTSIENPDVSKAETVIPEFKDESITNFKLNKEGLYYTTTKNGVDAKLYMLPYQSKNSMSITLPKQAGELYLDTKGLKFSDIWVYVVGWTSDYLRYKYNAGTKEFKEENLSPPAQYPEFNDLTVEEIEIPGWDGEKVPLSLIYNKSLKKDGSNPVFIFGYGAYGYSQNPFFYPPLMLWTTYGGILAIAHVRGGAEKGDSWYKAGYKTTKPNTWKDLISTAEYLIREKYTSNQKIAINSASAGGILIGRAMTERPDLFAVAIPEVGCLNPTRMEFSPNGPINVPEFGTMKDSAEAMALIEMDSYLHVKDGVSYPATLITAGMNDPRVIYWQPAKFAARLLAANKSDKPILFFTNFEAGHGMGNTKTKQFSKMADALSFALWQTGNPAFQLK